MSPTSVSISFLEGSTNEVAGASGLKIDDTWILTSGLLATGRSGKDDILDFIRALKPGILTCLPVQFNVRVSMMSNLSPKGSLRDIPSESLKDSPRDYLRDIPSESLKDSPRDYLRDISRESLIGSPRVSLTGSTSESLRVFPSESLIDSSSEYLRDSSSEYLRDFPRNSSKDSSIDYLRDIPRNPLRDFPTESARDLPTKSPKAFLRDFPSDSPKALKNSSSSIEDYRMSEAYGRVWGAWRCPLLSETLENLFRGWSYSETSKKSNQDLLTIFLLVRLHNDGELTENELRESAETSLSHLLGMCRPLETPGRGVSLLIESTPFGNPVFIDSISRGIVSNVLGTHDCLMLTDANAVPGCEGGPVYVMREK